MKDLSLEWNIVWKRQGAFIMFSFRERLYVYYKVSLRSYFTLIHEPSASFQGLKKI